MNSLIFVAVEFVDDPNVVGVAYWYLCDDISVLIGDRVIAPLGRHNTLQEGIVRKIMTGDEENSPYPVQLIKSIKKIIKEQGQSV